MRAGKVLHAPYGAYRASQGYLCLAGAFGSVLGGTGIALVATGAAILLGASLRFEATSTVETDTKRYVVFF